MQKLRSPLKPKSKPNKNLLDPQGGLRSNDESSSGKKKTHFVFASYESDVSEDDKKHPTKTKQSSDEESSDSSGLEFEDELIQEQGSLAGGIYIEKIDEVAGGEIVKKESLKHKRPGVLFRPLAKKSKAKIKMQVAKPEADRILLGITGLKRLQTLVEGAIKREDVMYSQSPSKLEEISKQSDNTNNSGPIINSRLSDGFLEENFFENEREYIYKSCSKLNNRKDNFSVRNRVKPPAVKKVNNNDFTEKEKGEKTNLEKLKVSHITKDICLDYEYSPDYCFNSMLDVLPPFETIEVGADYIEDKIKMNPNQKHIYEPRLLKIPRDSLHIKGEFPPRPIVSRFSLSKHGDHPLAHSRDSVLNTMSEYTADMSESEHMLKLETKKYVNRAEQKNLLDLTGIYRTRKFLVLNDSRRVEDLMAYKTFSAESEYLDEYVNQEVTFKKLTKNVQSLGRPMPAGYMGRRRDRKKGVCEQMNNNQIIFDKYMNDFVEIDKMHIKKNSEFTMKHLYYGIRSREEDKDVIKDLNWSGEQVLNSMDYPEYKTFNVVHFMNNQDLMIWLSGLSGIFKLISKYAEFTLETSTHKTIMTAATVINLIALMIEGLFDTTVNNIMASINFWISFFYLYELIIKLFAYGIRKYLQSFNNVIDAIVAVISTVEISYALAGKSDGSTLISATRVARLFRILRRFKFMRVIAAVISDTVEQYIYVMVIQLIFMYIFALLGMQIFGGQLIYDGNVPRANFDSFGFSFFTLFQLLTQENWQEILETLYNSKVPHPVTIIYLLCWLFLGNYLIFNLFLALLLGGFDSMDVNAIISEVEDEYKEIVTSINDRRKEKEMKRRDYEKKLQKQNKDLQFILDDNQKDTLLLEDDEGLDLLDAERLKGRACYYPLRNTIDDDSSLDSVFENILDQKLAPKYIAKQLDYKKRLFVGIDCIRSLNIFSKKGFLRKRCAIILTSPWFDKFIVLIILSSCVKLVIETYLNDIQNVNSYLKAFWYMEITYAAIFSIECLMKIIRCGLIVDKGSYLRDAWGWLELCIIAGSWAEFIVANSRISFLKVKLTLNLDPQAAEAAAVDHLEQPYDDHYE